MDHPYFLIKHLTKIIYIPDKTAIYTTVMKVAKAEKPLPIEDLITPDLRQI
jgi:hypothetical protein